MQYVLLLPPLIVAAACLLIGPRRALLYVFFPIFLLLPASYMWKFSAVPAANFHNYAFLIIASALVVATGNRAFRPSVLDLSILGYIGTAVYSELVMKGRVDFENMVARQIMFVLAPFLIGKIVGRDKRLMIAVFGAICVIGALIGWAGMYEARMGRNHFDFWRNVWPTGSSWNVNLYRAGIRRVAGPFSHPICQGYFFSLALPLFWWLAGLGLPKRRFHRWIIGTGLVLGLLLPVSRGPMIGFALTALIIGFGWSRMRLLLALLGGPVAVVAFAALFAPIASYVSVNRFDATNKAQETVGYRRQMLEEYIPVIQDSPWVGYGRRNFPVNPRLPSIDNEFLLAALSHGIPHLLFFVSILVIAILRNGLYLFRPPSDPAARLAWVFVGAFVGLTFTLTSVFSGTQTTQLQFLILGASVVWRPESYTASARTSRTWLEVVEEVLGLGKMKES